MAFSYWESKEWLEEADLTIIGGGIVGLSAALFAREKHPQWKITVLEAQPFGGGGSTKNAGFACFGSATELMRDRQILGDEATLELVRQRLDGLHLLRTTFGDAALGYRSCGSYEFFHPEGITQPLTSGEIREMNEWIEPATQSNKTFQSVVAPVPESAEGIAQTAIFSGLEGTLDTGKMNRAFRHRAAQAGIDVIHGCRIESIDLGEPNRQRVMLETKDGAQSIPTQRLIVATNAFGKELLPSMDVHPAVNRVLVTEPIEGWNFDHSVHFEAGYVYARNIDNRMLIGGGRHWELDEKQTEDRLIAWMHRFWPRTREVPVAYRWKGTLGVGPNRQPIVEAIGHHAVAAMRLGGMGVAIGMHIGKRAAKMLEEF